MMEAASTSETSVNFYQTTRLNIAEDSHLNTNHRESLKLTIQLVRSYELYLFYGDRHVSNVYAHLRGHCDSDEVCTS
jgi:hypothetical protein